MSLLWHLAIESSGLGGSLALFRYDSSHAGQLHSCRTLPAGQGSVRSLAPTADNLLRDAHLKPYQLDSLSVTCGPGSFTGLRVGLTTAKMLAWSADIPVVPVDTLAVIALRFVQEASLARLPLPPDFSLVTAINAFRRQTFSSSWRVRSSQLVTGPLVTGPLASGQLECIAPSQVIDATVWLSDPWQSPAQPLGPVWVSGGALETYPGMDPQRYCLAPGSLWQPMAEQVGWLGLQGLAAGTAVSAEQLAPNYIRASAAEESR